MNANTISEAVISMLAAVILTGHVDSVMINSMKIHHNDILLIDTWCLSFAVENVITSRSPVELRKLWQSFRSLFLRYMKFLWKQSYQKYSPLRQVWILFSRMQGRTGPLWYMQHVLQKWTQTPMLRQSERWKMMCVLIHSL